MQGKLVVPAIMARSVTKRLCGDRGASPAISPSVAPAQCVPAGSMNGSAVCMAGWRRDFILILSCLWVGVCVWFGVSSRRAGGDGPEGETTKRSHSCPAVQTPARPSFSSHNHISPLPLSPGISRCPRDDLATTAAAHTHIKGCNIMHGTTTNRSAIYIGKGHVF